MNIALAVAFAIILVSAVYAYMMVSTGRLRFGHAHWGAAGRHSDDEFDEFGNGSAKGQVKGRGLAVQRRRGMIRRPAQSGNSDGQASMMTNVAVEETAESALMSMVKADTFADSQKVAHLILPEEMKRLIEFTSDDWKPLMILACYSGMKAEELCGLMWEDVDSKKQRVFVKRIYVEGHFHDLDNSDQKRSIIIPKVASDALELHKEDQQDKGVPVKGYFVFTGTGNKEISVKMLTGNIFRRAAAGGCVKTCEFDDIRYSYAMALVNAGENLRFIQRQLGLKGTRVMFDSGDDDNNLATAETGASRRLAEIFGAG